MKETKVKMNKPNLLRFINIGNQQDINVLILV